MAQALRSRGAGLVLALLSDHSLRQTAHLARQQHPAALGNSTPLCRKKRHHMSNIVLCKLWRTRAMNGLPCGDNDNAIVKDMGKLPEMINTQTSQCSRYLSPAVSPSLISLVLPPLSLRTAMSMLHQGRRV